MEFRESTPGAPLAAALAVARQQDLPAREPRILRDMTHVLVHLAPALVVARVPLTFTLARGADWFAQEVELAGFLAARGAPVAPPAAEVPGSDEALAAYGDHDPALVEAAEPALTLCLAAWTLGIANRVGTQGVTTEARRRVERALAHV